MLVTSIPREGASGMSDHVVLTGADGRLDQMTAAQVEAMVAEALTRGRVVLHFHGGLVSKASGLGIAASLTPVYEQAGGYPIFFVWQSGAVEIIRHNVLEIAREELFERLLNRVLAWSVGKVRDVAGGRPGTTSPAEVDDELAARRRLTDPDRGAEPFPDEPHPEDLALSEAEEQAFLVDVENDLRLRRALDGALADRGLPATTGEGTRGVPDVPPLPTRMDPAVLEEVARGEDGEGARGLVSTLALAKKALVVLKAVLQRYALHLDSGLYATVLEEVLRAFYVAAVGGAEWQAMKKETQDTFLPGGDRGGRLVLNALARGLPANGSTRITLVGHSTGAVFIDNLLTEVTRRDESGESPLPSGQQFQLAFLAPAATTAHFAAALQSARGRVGRFRMFTMTPEAEKADRLVGAVYPRSLLYLVSGLLERDSAGGSAVTPLVGLSRYLGGDLDALLRSSLGTAARLAEVRAFLGGTDAFVLSPTDATAAEGLRARALKHGDFDNDPLVRESLAAMVRTW